MAHLFAGLVYEPVDFLIRSEKKHVLSLPSRLLTIQIEDVIENRKFIDTFLKSTTY